MLAAENYFKSAHAQNAICTSYLQPTHYCHQLFAGKLPNQNFENKKVNDNINRHCMNEVSAIFGLMYESVISRTQSRKVFRINDKHTCTQLTINHSI